MAVIAKPAPAGLDIAANRAARKWSRKELAGRLLWDLAAPVFALSPRPLWGLRRALLRAFGARIGRNVHILPSVRITIPWNLDIGDEAAVGEGAILYALGPIRIGRQATISQYAHLCAGSHDFTRADMPLLKPPIEIGEGAWICADAFVGPGVTVGARAVLGARAVAMKHVAPGLIVAGNPARPIRKRGSAP
jgi:putative colanic acid biosynthesis acetyltransferase WcaF